MIRNQGRRQKISRGRGQWKEQDRKIAPTSLPPFYQWYVK